jgi:hypothetical protein
LAGFDNTVGSASHCSHIRPHQKRDGRMIPVAIDNANDSQYQAARPGM